MKKIKIKAIVSILLLISFFIVSVSGIGLIIANKFAMGVPDWKFLGIFSKVQLVTMHIRFGIFMIFLVFVHFISNYKLFVNELKVLFGNK